MLRMERQRIIVNAMKMQKVKSDLNEGGLRAVVQHDCLLTWFSLRWKDFSCTSWPVTPQSLIHSQQMGC